MNYNPSTLAQLLALALSAMATGALVVYEVASNGVLLSYIQDLQEGGTGSPVGFVKNKE